ncbi:MAG: adenylate/guanylate cyclase domain-containing protein [Spirulina sp. SIO3F2]|nr:adenylate/guanylate cyclase domain-containing protein [Spirulina sp. SIO3F2]
MAMKKSGMSRKLWTQITQVRTIGLLSLGIAAATIALEHWEFFNLIEWQVRDQWVRSHTSNEVEKDIVIVTIDEPDLQEIGVWPIPDQILAKLLRTISAQNPSVIGMGIFRDLPVEPRHQELLEVYETTPNLIGIERSFSSSRVDPPPVLKDKSQVGFVGFPVDSDKKIRRAFLYAVEEHGTTKFSFGFKLAWEHLFKKYGIEPELLSEDRGDVGLGKGRFIPLNRDIAGSDTRGFQFLINWWGTTNSYMQVSMRDVLANRTEPELFSNCIVIIGSVAPSLQDFHITPYPEQLSGAIVYANTVSHLLHGALEGRSSLKVFKLQVQWTWIIVWTVIGTAGSWMIAQRQVTGNELSLILPAPFLALGILIGLSYIAWPMGYVIPTAAPGFALIIGVVLATNSYQRHSLKILNEAYERFVPGQFLGFLDRNSIVEVGLGDQVEREMTVLFSDIRDFTTISEQMTPAENFAFINEYLSRMEPLIKKHSGFIDKYIGDAIMALFSESADAAVQGSLAMLNELEIYNQTRRDRGLKPLRIGIGLHTGLLMLGTVGGLDRMDSTAIGDSVNLSSRVEGLTKNYGVSLLITHKTLSRLNNPLDYDMRFIEQVRAKGKAKAVALFEVFSADPSDLREAKRMTKVNFEQGVLYYYQQAFETASCCFQDCLDAHSGDRAAQSYLKRCQEHILD